MRTMSLYVTSSCNLSCGECIMQFQMKADRKYHMSQDEIVKLIAACEESGYVFNFVLTGGEPLMWDNLTLGLQTLKKSKATNSIVIFSNAMFHERVTQEVIDSVNFIRVSHYFYNDSHMKILKDKYPEKVTFVERTEFWANPTEAVDEKISLPCECMNAECMYYNYGIYSCPHSLSIAKHNGSDKVKLCNPVGKNFLDGLDKIKIEQQKEICTWCISNRKIRNWAEKKLNVSKGKEDLEKYGYSKFTGQLVQLELKHT